MLMPVEDARNDLHGSGYDGSEAAMTGEHLVVAPKRWTVEIQDAPDGSGDTMLELPDALWAELEAQGWQVDDVIEIDVSGPGRATIRNQYAECRRLSVPGKDGCPV
ncbi:hypothetical protein [Paraburkholderia sp. 35.1]|uniref:hypothetical protein n=1 Tax=Paraburkholderia sp. 35.1 TaxID=2991058 RepID=UPI003D234A5B